MAVLVAQADVGDAGIGAQDAALRLDQVDDRVHLDKDVVPDHQVERRHDDCQDQGRRDNGRQVHLAAHAPDRSAVVALEPLDEPTAHGRPPRGRSGDSSYGHRD